MLRAPVWATDEIPIFTQGNGFQTQKGTSSFLNMVQIAWKMRGGFPGAQMTTQENWPMNSLNWGW